MVNLNDSFQVSRHTKQKKVSRKTICCMAGNFHGVQIFIISVVDLAFTKISTTNLMRTGVMGMAKIIVAAQPTILSVSKQQ